MVPILTTYKFNGKRYTQNVETSTTDKCVYVFIFSTLYVGHSNAPLYPSSMLIN